jgi:hypothetical protein
MVLEWKTENALPSCGAFFFIRKYFDDASWSADKSPDWSPVIPEQNYENAKITRQGWLHAD